jgi:hypothetical protein
MLRRARIGAIRSPELGGHAFTAVARTLRLARRVECLRYRACVHRAVRCGLNTPASVRADFEPAENKQVGT